MEAIATSAVLTVAIASGVVIGLSLVFAILLVFVRIRRHELAAQKLLIQPLVPVLTSFIVGAASVMLFDKADVMIDLVVGVDWLTVLSIGSSVLGFLSGIAAFTVSYRTRSSRKGGVRKY